MSVPNTCETTLVKSYFCISCRTVESLNGSSVKHSSSTLSEHSSGDYLSFAVSLSLPTAGLSFSPLTE